MDRIAFLRRRLRLGMRIIEMGPSHRPIVPKAEGWATTVVDCTDRPGLLKKFAGQPVEAERIEDVDILWQGGDLAAAFPKTQHGRFDAIIASHVMEHMPDPIGFLSAAQTLLRPSGIIVLALPDKRYTFDFFGPLTSTGDWLTAYHTQARTHSRRAGYNHVAYHVTNDDRITWNYAERLRNLRFSYSLEDGLAHFNANTDDGDGNDYIDYHAWRFTPSSFMLLMLESCALTDIDWRVLECTPPADYEFFAVIGRGRVRLDNEALNAARLDLLTATMREMQQGNSLLDARL